MLSKNDLSEKILLAVIEQGGYSDFTALYEARGYMVETALIKIRVFSLHLDTVRPQNDDFLITCENFC